MEGNTLIEQKALEILDTYDGANNYLIKLKTQKTNNPKFYPTRSQSEYIIDFHQVQPKIAKKWVELDSYFAKKIADEKLFTKIPDQVWIEKLLVEKDKSYHIWGKFFSGDTIQDFWLPKQAIVKTHTIQKVEIDYEKYNHRPPLTHQKEAIEKLAGSKRYILADDMGLGKAIENNTLVYTPNGTKKIGDIEVGDIVIGSNGEPTKVIGVYPQGKRKLYKITFNDGFSVLTSDEHLWSVTTANYGSNRNNKRRKKNLVLSTKQMYEGGKIIIKGDGHNENKNYEVETHFKFTNGNSKWQIPVVKPIKFNNNSLPIDPYLLGLCLGDGHLTKTSCRLEVHKNDYDELFQNFNIKETKSQKNNRKGAINFGSALIDLNLNNTRSHNKFIPHIYKYSSINDRLSILQGLMDTDGYCMVSKNGVFCGTEFTTISKQLCDDVCEIVHTLGGIVKVKFKIPTYYYKGIKKTGKISYRLNIKLPSGMNPFRLKRKANIYVEPKKYKVSRYIKNIEKINEGFCTCISVDADDKLYVTEHAIVTHNTTSTIIAALETGAKKILIICPASLKINWLREIENYSDRSVFICEGKKYSKDHDFIIINYDIIKNFYDIKDKQNSPIFQTKFDLVIIDEAHYVQNPQAQRTKLINHFAKSIDRVWLLTGTPMTSRPINYFNLLQLIESPVAQNWMAYAIRYCQGYQFRVGNRKIWNTSGASNLDELRERTSKQVLRRLKTDVLDLPDKIITPVYLRVQSKEYEQLMGEYYDWYDKKGEDSGSLTVQFTKLMKVRQVIANEKVESTIELCENFIEQGKKVIVFTNFTDSLQRIYTHFGKNAVYLDGSMSKSARQDSVDKFQNDEKIKVFVGNIKAAGVGITLTSADTVIFNDLSFVPSDHSQAEDRAFRYGQKNNVLVYYPIFENTIEGIIYDILSKKQNIIDIVMGDNLDKADVVQEIMSRINQRN